MQAPDFIPQLLDQMRAETLAGRAVMPLAALCKRLNVRMSTLQRHLTALAEHELVHMHCDENGRWTAALSEAGLVYVDLPLTATAQAA